MCGNIFHDLSCLLLHKPSLTYNFSSCVHDFLWQRLTSYVCTGCVSECELLTAVNGSLSDGSGPSNYSNNANCEWIIASSNGSVIVLSFTEFTTQPFNDLVRVYQCRDIYCSQHQQLAELSGSYETLPVLMSVTGYMKVAFTSDSSINYNGFNATWSMVWSNKPHHACITCTQVD